MPSRAATQRSLNELPVELNDLLTLHSSFLTALSLHYAHNGTATPIDLRQFNPSVAQIWGKRKVTIDDIRLLLGVLASGLSSSDEPPFLLSDYGYSKICLEIAQQYKENGRITGPINEPAFQAIFMSGLEKLWSTYKTQHIQQNIRPIAQPKRRGRPRKQDTAAQQQRSIEPFIDPATSIPEFLSHLPLAEITLCASVQKTAPLLAKGRKRLRDIKDGQEQARAAKKTRESVAKGKENDGVQLMHASTSSVAPATATQAKITEFTQVRKANLLDRILAKQKNLEAMPTASPTELARKSALQRAEDVLATLTLMATSKGAPGARTSFSLASLCQALQGSLRSPISKEEAVRCVEVLANEVCPGYVGVVRMGSMVSVVVNGAARPVDVRGRLRELGAY